MNQSIRNIITESERTRILNLHNQHKQNRNYIFEACLSVDNRYFILHDNLFDIVEQKSLGNIWASIDNFKTIFNNTKVSKSNKDFHQIKESINNIVLLESDSNLYAIRDLLIEWSFWDDTWLGSKLKQTGTSVKDAFVDGFNKLKEIGIAISKGEWREILNLLGKGVVWVLRKLKDAAYSTLGVIVDAILVATGIGKGFQVAAWGLITALDVYQITSGDWPEDDNREEFWKYLDLGFDLLGLVFAGVAAKGARAIFKPLQGLSTKEMAIKVAQNDGLKSTIKKIFDATKSGGTSLRTVQSSISKKWPSGANFINKILGSFESVLKKLQTYLGQILKTSSLKQMKTAKIVPGKGYVAPVKNSKEFMKRAAVPTALTGGITYGIEKTSSNDNKIDDIFINNKIKPEFDGL